MINKPDWTEYAANANLNNLSRYFYLNISGTNANSNSSSSYGNLIISGTKLVFMIT
jgi:hypothetical protein